MKQLFLPPELSLISKQKGFDLPCFGYYNDSEFNFMQQEEGDDFCGYKNSEYAHMHGVDFYTAPLYQQIFDWLDSKGIFISIKYAAPDTNEFSYRIDCYNNDWSITTNCKNFYVKRIDAMNKAIGDALKLL